MTRMTNDSNSNKQSNVVLRSQCNEIVFSGSHNDDGMIYEYEKEKKVRTIVGEVLEDIISSISILPSSLPSLPSLLSSFPSPVVGSDDDDDENDNDVIIREGNNSTSNSYSTPLKEVQFTESIHREYRSNNRDVVLFGVNTVRKDNSNLKEIIKCNYERFYYQAKTIQERILIVEQIVLAVLSSNGRFIKLHRRRCRDNNNDDSNNNVGDNAGGGDCSIGKEVHVVDFNTARDRIIQIFQLTKERHLKKKKQQQQIAYNQVVNRTRTKNDDVSNGVISTGRDDNGTDNGTWQQQAKNSHSNSNSNSDSKSHDNSSNDNDEIIIKNRLAQAVQDTITLERNGRFLRKLSAIFLPKQPKKEVHEISSNSSSLRDLNSKNNHDHMNINGGVQGGRRRVPHYQGLLKQHQERQIYELQDLSRSRISLLRISVGMAGGLRGDMGSLLGGIDSDNGITGTGIDSSGTNTTTSPAGIDTNSMTHAALLGKIGGTIGPFPSNNSNNNSSTSTIMTMTDGMMNNADMMKMNGGLINSNNAVTGFSRLGDSTVTTNPIKIMEGPLNGTNHWESRPMMVGGNVSPPSLRQVSTLIDLPSSKRILPIDTLR
ncbi:hypothetical protein FRACYDRAFT_236276 [Fragilariopsis cylindrus CCMP1102]|uniref:Uncharacterized protein n=1 Tax=Fragilariopsis cylindrus CCMP1102 TaxID=635003 RepID=A0A1E7FPY2_9STRA|nr:hypothetical protein FRACYDRAFT_236276 [Fragilariopsis cylindrus CCMP1102]|eukprot:OEU20206.1 hypothetical protein FRACYDRAFT_236276 [Fragilariopsis cylindrus CCMP1102]